MTEERLYYVYKHTFPNGKIYIGITYDIEKRWRNGNGYQHQNKLNNAILKYGWNNIKHEILHDNFTKKQAEEKEKYYINLYKSNKREYGYNIMEGGNISDNRYTFTIEDRGKISKGLKGKYKGRHFSPKSEFKKGHTFTKEMLDKMSKAKIGKEPWNKGLKGVMSAWNKGLKGLNFGKNNAASKKIVQFDKQGDYIKIFDCISDAEREICEGKNGHFGECASNKIKTARGYVWRYYNDLVNSNWEEGQNIIIKGA